MSGGDEDIQIAVDGDHVAGALVRPYVRRPGVLFVHGWGGGRDQYLARAREISKLGCIALTFDLRGHGPAAHARDRVTREDNLRDVLAAFDRLASTPGVAPDAIAIVGSSYGAYLGAIASALRPVRWLSLRAPALYEDADWDVPKQALDKGRLHAYRRLVHRPEANRALRACAAFEGDVLVVASEHDDVVPHPTTESYVQACTRARSLTYRVLDAADHGLSDEGGQRAYTAVLVGWIREMAFGGSQSG